MGEGNSSRATLTAVMAVIAGTAFMTLTGVAFALSDGEVHVADFHIVC